MAVSFTLLMKPRFQALLADGTPNAGGKVYTYQAGTTTPVTTYTDPGLNMLNTNPVVLDSSGQADIHFSGPYKVVVTDAAGVQLYSADQLFGFKSDLFCSLPEQDEGRILAWSGVSQKFVNSNLDVRAIQFPEGAPGTLPAAATRAGKIMSFDAAGAPTVLPLADFIATVNDAEDWGNVLDPVTASDDWGGL